MVYGRLTGVAARAALAAGGGWAGVWSAQVGTPLSYKKQIAGASRDTARSVFETHIRAEKKMPNQSNPCNPAAQSTDTPETGRGMCFLLSSSFFSSGHLRHGVYIVPSSSLLFVGAQPAVEEIAVVPVWPVRNALTGASGPFSPSKSRMCWMRLLHHFFPLVILDYSSEAQRPARL